MRWIAGTLLALWLLARFIGTSTAWLDYPYPRTGSEGRILHETLLIKRGANIYDPITPARFISASNPPLYYWVASAFLPKSLPNLSEPGKVPSHFQPGRLISFLAALLAAALTPLLVLFDGGYIGKGRRVAFHAAAWGGLGGALFLSLPPVLVWAASFRGDMLALAFTVAGLTCVAASVGSRESGVGSRGPEDARDGQELTPQGPGLVPELSVSLKVQKKTLLYVAAATFFTLAFFTTQTMFAGPVAAAVYLLWRDWRRGLKWCAMMAGMVAVPFALIEVATEHWFYLKVFDYGALPLSHANLQRLLQFGFWEDQWPLLLAAGGYVLYVLFRSIRAMRGGEKIGAAPPLIPIFALFSLLTLPYGVSLASDHNRLLIAGFAICACVGALLARLFSPDRREREFQSVRRGVSAEIAFGLVAIYAIITSAPSVWYAPDLGKPSTAENEQMRKITLNIRQNEGADFYSDEPGILALAGKETPYNDPRAMTALAQQGRWDETAEQNRLREGGFSLLALSCDVTAKPANCRPYLFTDGVLDAMRDGYKVIFADIFFTYAPK